MKNTHGINCRKVVDTDAQKTRAQKTLAVAFALRKKVSTK